MTKTKEHDIVTSLKNGLNLRAISPDTRRLPLKTQHFSDFPVSFGYRNVVRNFIATFPYPTASRTAGSVEMGYVFGNGNCTRYQPASTTSMGRCYRVVQASGSSSPLTPLLGCGKGGATPHRNNNPLSDYDGEGFLIAEIFSDLAVCFFLYRSLPPAASPSAVELAAVAPIRQIFGSGR